MMFARRRLLGFAFGLAVVLTAGGLAGPAVSPVAAQDDDDDRIEFTVRQEPPDLFTVDLGEGGLTHGDMLVFAAPFAGDDGVSGTLRGVLLTTKLPEEDGHVFEERIGSLVFTFGESDTIVVHGGSAYPDGEVEMGEGDDQVRAVIGGTGKYIGARGQVTTTRNDDGSYDHRFELLD